MASIILRDMHSKSHNSLLDGITFTDYLPVDWEVLATLPSEGEQHRQHRANEELLKNLLLRDEAISQEGDEAEVVSGHEQFKRLETRLDLLLSLVTEMMTNNSHLPMQHAVTLGAYGLCVQIEDNATANLEHGTLLKIRLYLDPHFPRPLILYAQLVDIQTQSFTVNFCPLEECLQDQLDKYIFRQHRRAVALARKK
ncbi:MAG: PilZ domain-containing protein [Gammaproteobacteria bacterium]|nr:PilZ domain-containing protein [Gammaproteobacteria bacterium]